jgi:hypothetical protein
MVNKGREVEGPIFIFYIIYLKEPGMMFVCYMRYNEIVHEEYNVTHEHYWDEGISLLQLTIPVDR